MDVEQMAVISIYSWSLDVGCLPIAKHKLGDDQLNFATLIYKVQITGSV